MPRIIEPPIPQDDHPKDHLFVLATEQAKAREVERSEKLKNAIGHLKVGVIVCMAVLGGVVWLLTLAATVIAFGTFVIHAFLPFWARLSPDHQKALTEWYSNATQALFPVLVLMNPWVLQFLSRRLAKITD